MTSPPTWLAGPRSQDEAATGRRAAKATRKAAPVRGVLAQCERCLVNGTAVTNGRRIVSLNLAADFHRGQWTHHGCGGSFALFDIEVES